MLPILGLVNVGIVAIMFLLRNVVVVAAALLTEIMVSEDLVLAVLTQDVYKSQDPGCLIPHPSRSLRQKALGV